MAGVPAVAHSAVAAAFPFASDRKSTRLNSSHLVISYAVFCLKKKKSLLLHFIISHLNASPHLLSLTVDTYYIPIQYLSPLVNSNSHTIFMPCRLIVIYFQTL